MFLWFLGGVIGQQPATPISIMKKRSSNPIELRRSSGAVKIDLSSADKTIRRPGSEPDLKVEEYFNPNFFTFFTQMINCLLNQLFQVAAKNLNFCCPSSKLCPI